MDCILRNYNAVRAKAFGKKLSLADTIIFARSKPHTHSEFQFSKRYGNLSFSSTMRDEVNGCRFKQIDYNEHPERWDGLVLPMTDKQEDKAYAAAKELVGKGYDLFGLVSFLSEWDIVKPNPTKYWCSEACACLIKKAYGLSGEFVPDKFEPVGLFFEMYYRYVSIE